MLCFGGVVASYTSVYRDKSIMTELSAASKRERMAGLGLSTDNSTSMDEEDNESKPRTPKEYRE